MTNTDTFQKFEREEANVYSAVYRALVVGMIASSALYVLALVRALLHPQYIPLSPGQERTFHLAAVLHGLRALDPGSLMLVATVILIATPVARVILSIAAFAVDRDYKYVVVTSIVFLVIVATAILGYFGLR
jgi:uncharacterized membrane protein